MIPSWKYVQLAIACVWEQACEHLLGRCLGGHRAAEHTVSHWLHLKGSRAFGHERGTCTHPQHLDSLGVLPAGQQPRDNPGAALSLHKPRQGKVRLEKPEIWSRRSPRTGNGSCEALGREGTAGSLCTTHMDGEGPCSSRTAAGREAQLEGPRCHSRDPISGIKALA